MIFVKSMYLELTIYDLKGPVAPKPNKESNDCNKGFEVLEDEETECYGSSFNRRKI
jgi:hypothetical protein